MKTSPVYSGGVFFMRKIILLTSYWKVLLTMINIVGPYFHIHALFN